MKFDAKHRVVETARKYLGVRESRWNSSRLIDNWLRAVGLGPGYAWCAAFVSAVLSESGVQSMPKKGRAAVRNWDAWARAERRTIPIERVHVGDIYWWLNGDGTGHMGIVEELPERTSDGTWLVHTIEGNTNLGGSREGDGVYRKTRRVRPSFTFARIA